MSQSYVSGYVTRNNESVFPIVSPDNKGVKPSGWVNKNKQWLDENLRENGAVLLRGFDIHSLSEFNKFSLNYKGNLLSYDNASTPRTRLGGNIYTSTEYPKDVVIPQHNEKSYTNQWPNTLMFFSITVAEEGGYTPLADSGRILARLNRDILSRMEEYGILYVRNYHENLDLSWQEVFQTEIKEDVESYCLNNEIDFEWINSGEQLRTKQKSKFTLVHPETNEQVWFNQSNLFHISALGKAGGELRTQLGLDNVPRNCYFGNGEEIPNEFMEKINEAIHAETFSFPWKKGDILLVDNIRMTHGRTTFSGQRKVAVAMA
ncbi:TauD/TfdA family dioxygenase [Vibrio profundum]|uniref:TauD/TfdA family dioxygenase n=1 Tax=Vibrio profundum TaxID=2910247 RepID=UPI003D11F1D1